MIYSFAILFNMLSLYMKIEVRKSFKFHVARQTLWRRMLSKFVVSYGAFILPLNTTNVTFEFYLPVKRVYVLF